MTKEEIINLLKLRNHSEDTFNHPAFELFVSYFKDKNYGSPMLLESAWHYFTLGWLYAKMSE